MRATTGMALKMALMVGLGALALQAGAQALGAAGQQGSAAQKPARERVVQERVIPGGRAVWSQGAGPARAEDQTAQERAVVAMETAEQLLTAVEFYKIAMRRWPETLKQATERARLGVLPVILGLGPWELGERGSVQAPMEDAELCEALRAEGAARQAAGVGSPAGCQPDPSGSGRLLLVMTQLGQE